MKITEGQLTRAIYSQWDFQQALSSLTFLLEDCEFDKKYDKVALRRFRCYESNLIISMARPFEKTRSGISIGLNALGIKLTTEEKVLVAKVMDLRRKIIAHSSEEEMHFRATTFPLFEGKYNITRFQFNELLHLEESELRDIEYFLRKLLQSMTSFFFNLAQENPELLNKYKEPESFIENNEKR